MAEAKTLRSTSQGGTDLIVSIGGQRTGHQIGIVTRDHTWDNFGCRQSRHSTQ
jgi:leucyl aminopeptidase (aminopeptidase T)